MTKIFLLFILKIIISNWGFSLSVTGGFMHQIIRRKLSEYITFNYGKTTKSPSLLIRQRFKKVPYHRVVNRLCNLFMGVLNQGESLKITLTDFNLKKNIITNLSVKCHLHKMQETKSIKFTQWTIFYFLLSSKIYFRIVLEQWIRLFIQSTSIAFLVRYTFTALPVRYTSIAFPVRYTSIVLTIRYTYIVFPVRYTYITFQSGKLPLLSCHVYFHCFSSQVYFHYFFCQLLIPLLFLSGMLPLLFLLYFHCFPVRYTFTNFPNFH